MARNGASPSATISIIFVYVSQERRATAREVNRALDVAQTAGDQFAGYATQLVGRRLGPDAPGKLRLTPLNTLTEFESNLPDNATVVFNRPRAIQARALTTVTRVMRANGKKGVRYLVIGGIREEWKDIPGLGELIVPDLSAEHPVVLPSIGFVLYLLPESDQKTLPEADRARWVPTNHTPAHQYGEYACGFLIVPLGGEEEREWACAITLGTADIENLTHRVWPP